MSGSSRGVVLHSVMIGVVAFVFALLSIYGIQKLREALLGLSDKLYRQNRQRQNFIDNLGDNLVAYRHDLEGRLLMLSANFERIFGLSREQALRQPFAETINWQGDSLEVSYASQRRFYQKVIARDVVFMQFKHPQSGRLIYLRVHFNAVYDDQGEVIALEGIAEESARLLDAGASFVIAKPLEADKLRQ